MNRLHPGIVVLVCVLASCTTKPVGDQSTQPAISLADAGVTVVPPPGTGWLLQRRSGDIVIFRKHSSAADASPDPSPYLITAGVILPGVHSGFTDALTSLQTFRRTLLRQMNNPRQETIEFDASPVQRNGIDCISYRVLQVDRYNPEATDPRYQFSHRGFFCPLPAAPSRVVQAFYTEQTLRALNRSGDTASVHEARTFLDTVQIR